MKLTIQSISITPLFLVSLQSSSYRGSTEVYIVYKENMKILELR